MEVKGKFGSATAFTHAIHNLANNEGYVMNLIDNADAGNLGYVTYRIEYCIKTGSSTPTNGATFQFYLVTADDDGTQHIDGGVTAATEYGTGSSPHTAAQLRNQMQFCHAQAVRNATAITYKGSFVITVPAGRNWTLYCFNEIGQAMDTTQGNHYVRYIQQSQDIS